MGSRKHHAFSSEAWWSAGAGQEGNLMPDRQSLSLLIRLSVEALIAVLLVTVLVSSSQDQWRQANQLLQNQLAGKQAQVTALQSQVGSLQAEVQDLKERWYGSPAIWQPPAIANTDIKFFEVSGSSQHELITSLNDSSLCTTYVCLPDPANPSGIGWGLQSVSFSWNHNYCYSPSTFTLVDREFVLLPRWSPPADGSVKIPLVEKWNALVQVIYTHEAGHVAIFQQDLAALNDQAHHLPSCQALVGFWASPTLWDQLNADQNAYHARLRAHCRPEIGCIPYGWKGWVNF